MKKYLDNIAQWSALISAFFLVFGLIRAWLYYLAFGISILTYIDLSEIFIIWFPDTMITLVVTLAWAFLIYAVYELKPEDGENYVYYNSIVYVAHFGALLFIVGDLVFNWFERNSGVKAHFNSNSPYLLLMCMTGIFGFFFFINGFINFVQAFRKREANDPVVINRGNGMINATFVAIYVFIFMIYEPIGTIRETPDAYTIVELKGEKQNFVSDSTNRYVGKTRNYIFISNIETGATTALPVSDYHEIKMLPNPRRKTMKIKKQPLEKQ
jgi:hypothetical protein